MSAPFGSQNLDHLGLVAAMYDDLGIGEVLDRLIPQNRHFRRASVGQAVKALVLNGLGFVNRALYLTPQFFSDKPVERLIGAGVTAEHLNDDTLGRALDSLYRHDVELILALISAQASQRLGLTNVTAHLDSTSFHTDGLYDIEPEEGVIEVVAGYSRDHRPELNQVMLNLVVEQRAGLPLLMQPLSGNSSDKTSFRQLIERHIDNLNPHHSIECWIADSALYSEANLKVLAGQRWISRVPETIALAKQLCSEAAETEELMPGYCYRSVTSNYAGIAQRWLVITSIHRLKGSGSRVDKHLTKQSTQQLKHWQKLSERRFGCEHDAREALKIFQTTLKSMFIEETDVVAVTERGRTRWQIVGHPASVPEARWLELWKRATFILATNELDTERLSDQQVLQRYKEQQHVERGFRFLKDPRFQANTIFLKSPHRIMALLMVMTLCLMVYAALQYRLRQALSEQGSALPDQKGKLTQKPTMRWIFQFFTGIHVLLIENQAPRVLNLKPWQEKIVGLLGPPYCRIYDVEVVEA